MAMLPPAAISTRKNCKTTLNEVVRLYCCHSPWTAKAGGTLHLLLRSRLLLLLILAIISSIYQKKGNPKQIV
jgi:hypothetical protein